MKSLTTDTQDEIVRALGYKVAKHRGWVERYMTADHNEQPAFIDLIRAEERRLNKSIAAYNEVAQQLNIKPIEND